MIDVKYLLGTESKQNPNMQFGHRPQCRIGWPQWTLTHTLLPWHDDQLASCCDSFWTAKQLKLWSPIQSSMILCPNHTISLTGYRVSSRLNWHISWQDGLGELYRSTHLSAFDWHWILTFGCRLLQSMISLGRTFSYFAVVTKVETYDSYRTSPKDVFRPSKHLFKAMKTVPLWSY
jgi:hypothetical protein